jgi:hypothetical protein
LERDWTDNRADSGVAKERTQIQLPNMQPQLFSQIKLPADPELKGIKIRNFPIMNYTETSLTPYSTVLLEKLSFN